MPQRAPFIVLEGLDRSGKSTQAAILESRLSEEYAGGVKLLKFPDRTTPIGRMIDSYLRSESEMDDRAIHLLFSANRWELSSTIEKLLDSGTAVIADRYAFSGIAFTLSKPTFSPPPAPSAASSNECAISDQTVFPSFSAAYQWCQTPDRYLPAPDLTLFLDVPPSIAKQRAAYGLERYENEELQARVRETFGLIGKDMTGSFNVDSSSSYPSDAGGPGWAVIDAGNDLDSVTASIWSSVAPILEHQNLGPIKRLWAEES